MLFSVRHELFVLNSGGATSMALLGELAAARLHRRAVAVACVEGLLTPQLTASAQWRAYADHAVEWRQDDAMRCAARLVRGLRGSVIASSSSASARPNNDGPAAHCSLPLLDSGREREFYEDRADERRGSSFRDERSGGYDERGGFDDSRGGNEWRSAHTYEDGHPRACTSVQYPLERAFTGGGSGRGGGGEWSDGMDHHRPATTQMHAGWETQHQHAAEPPYYSYPPHHPEATHAMPPPLPAEHSFEPAYQSVEELAASGGLWATNLEFYDEGGYPGLD